MTKRAERVDRINGAAPRLFQALVDVDPSTVAGRRASLIAILGTGADIEDPLTNEGALRDGDDAVEPARGRFVSRTSPMSRL